MLTLFYIVLYDNGSLFICTYLDMHCTSFGSCIETTIIGASQKL